MSVVVRFAPSPTGFLHLGGARTALFNWLFAKQRGGKFLLRIEDTDLSRSTPEALHSILKGLAWLGLKADDEPVFQHARKARHKKIAELLLEKGAAYWCDTPATRPSSSPSSPLSTSTQNKTEVFGKNSTSLSSNAPSANMPSKPVLRFKINRSGHTRFKDIVQGAVEAPSDTLHDLVLLRSDGSPTYMLAVVADDHDMGITHVIRGVDHLTNSYHQVQIYEALGWVPPVFAHIPLIHGMDGAKLSKRHGAVDINHYKGEGFLPEAMRNALLRLGFGSGNQEIFSDEEALKLFDLSKVGRNPARFDPQKLQALNAHYIKHMPEDKLFEHLKPFWDVPPSAIFKERLIKGFQALQERVNTLKDLATQSLIYSESVPELDEKAKNLLSQDVCYTLHAYTKHLTQAMGKGFAFSAESLEEITRQFAKTNDLKLGKVAQPLRAALTGRTVSPPLFEVMAILGKASVFERLEHHARTPHLNESVT